MQASTYIYNTIINDTTINGECLKNTIIFYLDCTFLLKQLRTSLTPIFV